jgi:hypothetical protein
MEILQYPLTTILNPDDDHIGWNMKCDVEKKNNLKYE